MPDIEKDHPIVRDGLKWRFRNRRFWFKRNAENERSNFIIYNLHHESFMYHLKNGTKGYC